MDRFRTILHNIRKQLGGMSGSQRLLVGSLSVIVLMTLLLVSQYATSPAMVDLMNADPNVELVSTLRAGGIDARVVEGSIVVPPSQRRRAVSTLSQAGQLPGDTTVLFSNLLEHQDWKAGRQQNHQQYLLAVQNELARVIRTFPNVASADVFIDAPEPSGLGGAARTPTASVIAFTVNQSALPQRTVDAIARLVSGPVSTLRPTSVEVVDQTGPRSVTDDQDLAATAWLEHAQKVEKITAGKLRSLLAHIPGVVISVTAQVDVTRVTTARREHLKDGQGSVAIENSRTTDEDTETAPSVGGEPGVRSNQQADINTGSGAPAGSSRTSSQKDFEVAIGSEIRETYDPRGMPTFLAASVSVPETYIEQLLERARARAAEADDSADEPAPLTEAEVTQRFEAIKTQLEDLIRPHLTTRDDLGTAVPGEVSVSMVPSLAGIVPGTGAAGTALGAMTNVAGRGGGGIPLGPLGSISVETVLIAVLAIAALLMMTSMARKAGRRIELPPAHELVGIPPSLGLSDQIVGEAEETDAAMEGIEVDESQVKSRKLLEQVGELVGHNPEIATGLLGRWIESEH